MPMDIEELERFAESLRTKAMNGNAGKTGEDGGSGDGAPDYVFHLLESGETELTSRADLEGLAAEKDMDLDQQGEQAFRQNGTSYQLPRYVLKTKAVADPPKSPPKGYPKDKGLYADPDNYKYPIDTEARVRAALSYWGKPDNQKGYSPDEKKKIESRLVAAAKKFGIETTLGQSAGSSAKKEFAAIEDKDALKTAITDFVTKGMKSDDEAVRHAVTEAERLGFEPYLPVEYGGAGLDWDDDLSAFQTKDAGEGDGSGQATLDKKDEGPNAQQKDFEDDYDGPMPMYYSLSGVDLGDDEKWIPAMRTLCNSFVDAVDGLDDLQDAASQSGLGVPFTKLLAQLTAGLQTIYDASGEETEFEGAAVEKAVQLAIQETFDRQKAGRRHSKGDVSLLRKMHDGALDTHAQAIALEPTVCTGDCPMGSGSGTGTTKGMTIDDQHPDSRAEVERLQALIGEREAEVERLQAKAMKLEGDLATTAQERADLQADVEKKTRLLDGLRRSLRPIPDNRQPDPLGEQSKGNGSGAKKGLKVRPMGAQNVHEFLIDDTDYRITR